MDRSAHAALLAFMTLVGFGCGELRDFDVQVREALGTRGKTGRGLSAGVTIPSLTQQQPILVRAGESFNFTILMTAESVSLQGAVTASGFLSANALPLTVTPLTSTTGSVEVHGITNLAVGDYILTLSAPGYQLATRAIRVEPQRFPALPTPFGGAVALTGHSVTPGAYLVQTPRGPYSTSNSGQTWSLLRGPLAGARVKTRSGFTILATQPLGTTIRVFRSFDLGSTLSELPQITPPTTGAGTGPVIGLSEGAGARTFVGINSLLYRLDSGETAWAQIGSLPGEFIGSVLVDRSDANVVYVATAFGLYRSGDGGATLASIAPSPSFGSLNSLQQDDVGRLWVAQGTSLFRSADQGQTWTTLSLTQVSRAAVFAGQPASVAAVTSGALQFSSDDGASFLTRALPTGVTTGVPFLASATELFLVASTDGVYRSQDAGQTWSTANTGMRGHKITALFTPSPGLLVLSLPTGNYRSTDNGQSWSLIASLPAAKANDMAELQGVLFGCGSDGVYRSTDSGQSWTLTSGTPIGFRTISVGGGALYAAGRVNVSGSVQEAVLQSSDGASWTVTATFPSTTTLGTISSLGGSSTLIGGPSSGSGSIQVSQPGGVSWQDRSSGLADLLVGGEVLGHPTVLGRALALGGSSFALYETSDAGLSWTRRIDASQLSPSGGRSIAYSPDGLTIWASGLEGGAMRIRSGQLELRGGLGEFERTDQVRVDPGASQRVYLVGRYGLSTSQNGGD